MAINDGGFDPSKRIRMTLGEEYSSNLETEAINRLSMAMASNGMRRTENSNTNEELEENMDFDRIKNIAKNIKHTNPIDNADPINLEGKSSEERIAIRKEAFNVTETKFNDFIGKKSFGKKIISSVSGITIGGSKKEVSSEFISFGINNAVKFVQNNSMEAAHRFGSLKGIGITTSVNVVCDFISQSLISGNTYGVSELFDKNVITSAEAHAISKVIRNEKVKYAAQHTLATVIIPSVVKFGINKIAGEKIRDNDLLSAVTSYGLLSELGNIGLKFVRRRAEKKYINNVDKSGFKIDEATPISAYNTIARIAINHSINETICDTLPGSAIGSIVGHKSVTFDIPKEENEITTVVNEYVSEKPKKVKETKKDEPVVSTEEALSA